MHAHLASSQTCKAHSHVHLSIVDGYIWTVTWVSTAHVYTAYIYTYRRLSHMLSAIMWIHHMFLCSIACLLLTRLYFVFIELTSTHIRPHHMDLGHHRHSHGLHPMYTELMCTLHAPIIHVIDSSSCTHATPSSHVFGNSIACISKYTELIPCGSRACGVINHEVHLALPSSFFLWGLLYMLFIVLL